MDWLNSEVAVRAESDELVEYIVQQLGQDTHLHHCVGTANDPHHSRLSVLSRRLYIGSYWALLPDTGPLRRSSIWGAEGSWHDNDDDVWPDDKY